MNGPWEVPLSSAGTNESAHEIPSSPRAEGKWKTFQRSVTLGPSKFPEKKKKMHMSEVGGIGANQHIFLVSTLNV